MKGTSQSLINVVINIKSTNFINFRSATSRFAILESLTPSFYPNLLLHRRYNLFHISSLSVVSPHVVTVASNLSFTIVSLSFTGYSGKYIAYGNYYTGVSKQCNTFAYGAPLEETT